jgi:hypothetical protein
MKKLIAAAVLALALAAPAGAAADAGGYGSQPGYEVANGNTQCAGHGAFGAFGNFGDVVHDFGHVYPGDSNGKPGANGEQTGINNGTLCGNRQGNL